MCPSLTPKSKKERPQESFQLINTSNLSNIYSTSLKSFRMVVYDVSSIVSKNRSVSDGKLLPTCNMYMYSTKKLCDFCVRVSLACTTMCLKECVLMYMYMCVFTWVCLWMCLCVCVFVYVCVVCVSWCVQAFYSRPSVCLQSGYGGHARPNRNNSQLYKPGLVNKSALLSVSR